MHNSWRHYSCSGDVADAASTPFRYGQSDFTASRCASILCYALAGMKKQNLFYQK